MASHYHIDGFRVRLELLALDFLKLSEVFPGPTSGARVKELKAWLGEKGVRDFEPVPLNCDKVGKVRS
jgi:hypothetical protein